LAESVTVGLSAGTTVTFVDVLACPPEPMQVSVKLADCASALVVSVPLGGLSPLHPPDATQRVADSEVQCRVAVPFAEMVCGLAMRLTTGAS